MKYCIGTGESGFGGGLTVRGFRGVVEHNQITDNEIRGPGICAGGGVMLNWENDELHFRNNWISGNRLIGSGQHWGGGVCIWQCSPKFTNNIVAGNAGTQGGGVYVGGGYQPTRPQMINNTICSNSAPLGSGIYATGSYPVVVNSILWNDSADIYQSGGLVTVQYSDVRGGWPGTGNIEVNPMFLDTTYRLRESSPCIGAGIDSTQIGGTWYHAPSFCFYGGLRPQPNGTTPDIGACESPLAIPTGVHIRDEALPIGFVLKQNYPNPFNPTTVISYQLPVASMVRLVAYDLLGREVAVLVDETKEPGRYEVTFDAANLSSGVYFYRMQVRPLDSSRGRDSRSGAGDFVQTCKLLLLR